MLRWLVIVLATAAALWALCFFFPVVQAPAFVVRGFVVRWVMLAGVGLCYAFHRFTQ